MKREIRFRAWLKAESKMCTIDLLRFDTGAFLVGAEPAADQIIVNMKLKVKVLDNGRFCNNGEFELMQFTGLIDDEGKEIYEGDIINNSVAKWIVIFNTGCFCAEMTDHKFKEGDIFIALRAVKGKKVIGNIYANPELI